MLLFFASTVAISVASFLQTTELISIGLIKPNISLVLLIVLASIYKEWNYRFVLALVAGIILKFTPSFGFGDIVFLATILLGMALLDYMPWRRLINIEASVFIGTIILNLTSIVPMRIVLEIATNAILTIIVFIIAQIIYAEEIKSQENRF